MVLVLPVSAQNEGYLLYEGLLLMREPVVHTIFEISNTH